MNGSAKEPEARYTKMRNTIAVIILALGFAVGTSAQDTKPLPRIGWQGLYLGAPVTPAFLQKIDCLDDADPTHFLRFKQEQIEYESGNRISLCTATIENNRVAGISVSRVVGISVATRETLQTVLNIMIKLYGPSVYENGTTMWYRDGQDGAKSRILVSAVPVQDPQTLEQFVTTQITLSRF
jgi:hypothetical protein